MDRIAVEKTVVVGRRSTCDWIVLDSSLSGEHFRLYKTDQSVTLTDCRSTNGTFVNGVPLAPDTERPLADGDVIRAGDFVKVFSNVEPRIGVIEKADGGTLLGDEVHNLPPRVQRGLLRLVEDGLFSRIGETTERPINVRFILASNAPPPAPVTPASRTRAR